MAGMVKALGALGGMLPAASPNADVTARAGWQGVA
jgi:hypothetical protein